ncbi:MAG: hypothetical protein J2P28_24430 [Actinobacteria bacterium]|nr:hypothetical protein [Actinomycetota bacterium]
MQPPTGVGVTAGRREAAEHKESEMSVVMVRQKVKEGSLDEAEAAVRDLFASLDRVRPEGIRYASTRVVDSSTFVILTELADGIEDPRPAISEYQPFLEQLKGWVDGPPVIERLDVVGSYNLFGTQPRESRVR